MTYSGGRQGKTERENPGIIYLLYSITNQKNWFALMVLALVCTSVSHVRVKRMRSNMNQNIFDQNRSVQWML